MGADVYTLVYDGHCEFCVRGSRAVARLAAPGAVTIRALQEPGVIGSAPGLTLEACRGAMQLIDRAGRRFSGGEAAVRALATRFGWSIFVHVYYLPVVRGLVDRLYRTIARNRYRILGRRGEEDGASCASGTCTLPG